MQHLPPPAADRVAPLGYAPMDSIHEELDSLLLRARTTTDENYLALLVDIDNHLRAHFAEEDRWMRETDFPPRDCHIDEHAAVLRSSTEVLALAREGRPASGRGFVEELARWFPGHADYLDSALAAWMFKREHGGKPVVLHRNRTPG
jgi:hemerythrin